jgi:hypothetical protein
MTSSQEKRENLMESIPEKVYTWDLLDQNFNYLKFSDYDEGQSSRIQNQFTKTGNFSIHQQ